MHFLIGFLILIWPLSVTADPFSLPSATAAARETAELYEEIGLSGIVAKSTFEAALRRAESHGLPGRMIAIADMTLPSTSQRLYVIDLQKKALVLRTWVAHGQGSGDLLATRFSNRGGSHQTSLGLYRVGTRIVSPKHGPALLLEGLDKGINDKALAREIIVHGADYVSGEFIAARGRLGRSWGCPAVPRSDMPRVMALLADGGLLYIHGG